MSSFLASSGDIGAWRGETGEQSCWARERAVVVGMRILCSVFTFPRTFSANLLSNSAGKGSLPPKSPSRSGPEARVLKMPRGRRQRAGKCSSDWRRAGAGAAAIAGRRRENDDMWCVAIGGRRRWWVRSFYVSVPPSRAGQTALWPSLSI